MDRASVSGTEGQGFESLRARHFPPHRNSGLRALVLAAGASRRYGRPKQLLRLNGEALVARAARLAVSAGAATVCVVLGYRAVAIDRALRKGPSASRHVYTVLNPRWRDGMGHSLAFGIAALDRRARAVLVCLADQPLLESSDLAALARIWRNNPRAVVASRYAGKLGAPAIFPRSHFRALKSLAGDRGARGLLAGRSNVLGVSLPRAATDIDRPQDLLTLTSQTPVF